MTQCRPNTITYNNYIKLHGHASLLLLQKTTVHIHCKDTTQTLQHDPSFQTVCRCYNTLRHFRQSADATTTDATTRPVISDSLQTLQHSPSFQTVYRHYNTTRHFRQSTDTTTRSVISDSMQMLQHAPSFQTVCRRIKHNRSFQTVYRRYNTTRHFRQSADATTRPVISDSLQPTTQSLCQRAQFVCCTQVTVHLEASSHVGTEHAQVTLKHASHVLH